MFSTCLIEEEKKIYIQDLINLKDMCVIKKDDTFMLEI